MSNACLSGEFLVFRWTGMLIVAPELYHWHHDHDAGNYANLSPLMDNLFGTCRPPGVEPEAFGIKEPIPRSYLGQRWYPFKRRWPLSSAR
ncbi:MAG: hypothetical protein ABF370_18345 [Verrucomicrobiales bacterium]